MDRDWALAILRAHEAELRAAGIESLAIFGSVARGDATDASDIDVAVRLRPGAHKGGFAYFGYLADLSRRLEAILGRPVDVVTEPVYRDRLRQSIEREAARAF
jgi:uncharacterized protein